MHHDLDDFGDLVRRLAEFEASTITALGFNIWANTVTVEIQSSVNEGESHAMEFLGVSSVYFVNGPGNSRFNPPNWEFVEMSDITFMKEGYPAIIHKSGMKGVAEHRTSANFAIDIASSLLLIEAKTIIIDGKEYEVGYP
jgi:hypothetical protein